jgi:hypothetical protein
VLKLLDLHFSDVGGGVSAVDRNLLARVRHGDHLAGLAFPMTSPLGRDAII